MTEETTKYFQDLIKEFPDLGNNISFDEGEHSNMERFADYTIAQIKKSNFVELKKCFEFQEQRITKISDDLENAMVVSYCESLLLGEIGKLMPNITKYMGVKLLKMYQDYENHYNELVESSKRNDH